MFAEKFCRYCKFKVIFCNIFKVKIFLNHYATRNLRCEFVRDRTTEMYYRSDVQREEGNSEDPHPGDMRLFRQHSPLLYNVHSIVKISSDFNTSSISAAKKYRSEKKMNPTTSTFSS